MASIKKYELKSGYKWMVQYRSPDGHNRKTRGFPTKAAAEAWAAKNTVSIHSHDWVNPNLRRATITETAQPWLAHIKQLSPSSQRVYTISWEKHVQPTWGHMPIGSIRPSAVQKWVDEQFGGAATVRRNVNVLSQILDYAVKDGTLKTNPARSLRLPKKSRPVQVYLTAKQLRALADEAGSNAPIVMLLGAVGLRWGELAGLKVGDIHFSSRRIHVQRNAVTVGAEVKLGPMKTGEDRWVAVPDVVLTMLTPLCANKSAGAWVWERPRVGGPMKLPSKGSWFEGAVNRIRAVDDTFPELTIHGLRHVAAGLMVSQGANVLAVARQLGHADPSMTLRTYSALFDSDLDDVATAVNSVLCADVAKM